MARTHMLHAGGAQSLHAACGTKPRTNPVVGNKAVPPQFVALALPPRLHSRNPQTGGALGKLCDSLAVFGCNVNPRTTGTTGRVDQPLMPYRHRD